MKKKYYALPFLLLLCTLTACGGAAVQNKLDFFAMDTVMTFSAYADKSLLGGARDIVMNIESRVSTTLESSEVYALNRDGGGTVSGETAALLEHVDYARIRVSGDAVTLPDGMEIDLGGVAKGYAGREAAAYLRRHGVASGLLNLGGNVQTIGSKPDGTAWRVAIRDPNNDTHYAGIVEIRDKAAVTSGGYERYFTADDGQTYWHIMNPATGRPARNGVISATVIADDGALCDALSTALFVMGAEKAERFWRNHPDFDMALITDDGEILLTPGLTYEPVEGVPYAVRTLEA